MPKSLYGRLSGGGSSSTGDLERIKSLTYSATVNKLLLDVEAATTEGSVKTGAVGEVEIVNTGNHPAIFPEQLANDQIISWSNEGDLVYDCFMGSGTTAKMAILNNRNYIGTVSYTHLTLPTKRIV